MVARISFLLLSCLVISQVAADDSQPVDFARQIRPLLSDRCFTCHGPDANNRQADLRLDTEEHAKQTAIVPGKPEESELVQRILSQDADIQMPPPDSKLSLSSAEKQLFQRWIAEGAPWQSHWAFLPPKSVPPPKLTGQDWPTNEIDHFVLHRLRAANLEPAAEADRATLLRRVTFDLTGVPPSLAELDAFLADKSPSAYENVINRLLSSKRYGERMASEWLDVARYSDTFGYQVDRDRHVWPYRDWVIRAFNNNMPYDAFVTQQLAGDLLPHANDDQILATTFNRLHPQKVEGGSTPEEFRIEYVADRTQTFATGVLGLTMECCRCHDHKYDPLAQREYYQLAAFFDNIDEAGLYSYFTSSTPTPTLLLADENTKTKIQTLVTKIDQAEHQLASVAANRKEPFATWLKGSPQPTIPGQIQKLSFEEGIGGENVAMPGIAGQSVRLSGDDGIGLKVGNFRRFQPFSVALWMQTPDVKDRAVVFHRSRAWTDAASRGYELLILDGQLQAALIHFWPGNAISIRTQQPLATKQWHHVVMTYDGSSRADGLKLIINGQPADCEVIYDNLYKNITGGGGDNITIGQRFRDRGFKNGLVDEFLVYNRQLTAIEAAQLHDQKALDDAFKRADALTERQRASLYAYYLSTVDPEYQQQLRTLQSLREERSKLVDNIREIMVMRESANRRQSYLLARGAYDARADAVSPGTPSALPAFPPQLPQNRLGLAQWCVDREHPLTARVAVNRYWQMLFGQGLVRTPEDFGRQGQPPSHPELLDWLACDFAKDWNVQRLLKQMLMSATYQQSSHVSSKQHALDPENRLLSHASTYRLPAEMLRDQALVASGLLVEKIGGPPAKPYEVEVSFKSTKRQRGDGLYRRSIYTYWKRTGPAPVMMTLDASKRDVCRVKRERTSTPLQTFVLMNGPQFVEAARMLAQSLLLQQSQDTKVILSQLFRTLTSRQPTEAEAQVLQTLFAEQLQHFQNNPASVDGYLQVGDAKIAADIDKPTLAALASVANALLSYDEVVMKY